MFEDDLTLALRQGHERELDLILLRCHCGEGRESAAMRGIRGGCLKPAGDALDERRRETVAASDVAH